MRNLGGLLALDGPTSGSGEAVFGELLAPVVWGRVVSGLDGADGELLDGAVDVEDVVAGGPDVNSGGAATVLVEIGGFAHADEFGRLDDLRFADPLGLFASGKEHLEATLVLLEELGRSLGGPYVRQNAGLGLAGLLGHVSRPPASVWVVLSGDLRIPHDSLVSSTIPA